MVYSVLSQKDLDPLVKAANKEAEEKKDETPAATD